ncbi:uncharacterized protein A4U43_C10F12690 [Asparagus officinalis]|uniref:PHD-type domain-containing protein n=1 Tax=Asparagus officinalis TaxID=4686 RepID=A0A5P1E5K6_ASPOF|nr:PHD finger protein At1g33420-like [Asparagus officinalis]ONK56767.1 uncharacterized protein A4U43_C10F12690 [Asparagus officinalis]
MVVNGRPLKRAKRRVTADLLDFLAFSSVIDAGGRISEGAFRSSVRSFLSKHARLPPPPPALIFTPSAMTTWRVSFRIGGEGIVEMDIVEEEVIRSKSVYCDQCRVVGWSGHPVCRKRYHFIIRNNNNPFSGYHQMCMRCGSMLHMLDSR